LLFELVDAALIWRKRTGGIFDPTVLQALLAHGYDRSFEEIVGSIDQNVSAKLASATVWSQVKLNRAKQTITLPQGVGLDLGGIAKGWTVQQASQKLGQLGPALVDAGGDIACSNPPPSGSPWLVGIDDPLQTGRELATLTLNNEAVATSSLVRRRWQHQGQVVHHLIDPRTGAPALTDVLSVTVIGSRLPDAEIAAKVALILGEQEGLAYLKSQPQLSALLVKADGHQLTCGKFEEKAYVYSRNFTDNFITLV
jgi:thiamine biosynthesis lipoprotein